MVRFCELDTNRGNRIGLFFAFFTFPINQTPLFISRYRKSGALPIQIFFIHFGIRRYKNILHTVVVQRGNTVLTGLFAGEGKWIWLSPWSLEATRIGNNGEMTRHEGEGGMSAHTWQVRDMTRDGKRGWENVINCTLYLWGGGDSREGGFAGARYMSTPRHPTPRIVKGKHLWFWTSASNSIPKARLIPSLPVYFAGIQPLSLQLTPCYLPSAPVVPRGWRPGAITALPLYLAHVWTLSSSVETELPLVVLPLLDIVTRV